MSRVAPLALLVAYTFVAAAPLHAGHATPHACHEPAPEQQPNPAHHHEPAPEGQPNPAHHHGHGAPGIE
ncbi:MAG TPA: hypothetical protein VMK65_09295, partial [Longimicrobiales bacterium]|nr:hypothetical protein [Longimicrobiales bacterium]